MKKYLMLVGLAIASANALAAPFTPNSIVVERLGNGSTTLSGSSAPISVLEFTTSGSLSQTITLASSGTSQQTDAGSATSNGYLNTYVSGGVCYVSVPGLNLASATASAASSNNKVNSTLDASGSIINRTLFPTTPVPGVPFSSNNYRSSIATSGSTFYAAGAASGSPNTGGAWFYNGTSFTQVSSTATGQPTNLRVVEIYNNQLYATSSASTGYGIFSIGSGLPTTASNASSLQINAGTGASPYGFVMFDTNNDNTLDLAYLADDRTTAGGGLQKWTLNGSTWTNSWSLLVGGVLSTDTRYKLQSSQGVGWAGLRGLAGKYDATTGTTTLYATTSELTDNRIISISDSDTGSTVPSTYTELASAGSNYVFRGVDLIGSSISAPTVTNVSPASGSTLGGTNVTITGTDFTGATGVTIGGTAATSVSVVNATTITATTPAGSAGTASVVVTTPAGSNAANTLFTYANQAPAITSNGGGTTAAINVAENTTAVTTVTATVEAPLTKTFSISGGADSARFSINSSTGVLTFATAPNYEVPTDGDTDNVYEVTVRIVDDGSPVQNDTQALSVTVTNVNELPSFTKGGDQSVLVGTSTAQSISGWATALNDGDSTVTQALSFTITGNTNAGLFATAPAISSDGTLTYTPATTMGEATITVTMSDDTSIDGSALTTASQSFKISVVSIYEQWASTNNVRPTLMTDDDDTDGVPNLLEFAFGTNPQAGSSGPQQLAYSGTFAGGGSITGRGQPDVDFESVTNGVDYRALFVRRKDHAAAGLSYTVEFSANLTTWQPTSVSPTVLADDGVYQVVSVPYMSFIQGRKVKFFRVQVGLAP